MTESTQDGRESPPWLGWPSSDSPEPQISSPSTSSFSRGSDENTQDGSESPPWLGWPSRDSPEPQISSPSTSSFFSDSVEPLNAVNGSSKMPNITKVLEKRRYGEISSVNFRRYHFEQYCRSLSLFQKVDFKPTHVSAINTMDVDPTERFLLSGGQYGNIYVHDLFNFSGEGSYRCIMEIFLEAVTAIPTPVNVNAIKPRSKCVECVQWYPYDTGLFVSSAIDGFLRLWETQRLAVVESYNYRGKIYQHHISKMPVNGTTFLIAVATSSNNVKILDPKSGHHTHEVRGHTSQLFCCQWSPITPFLLATGSSDSTIKLWDIRKTKSSLGTLNTNHSQEQPQASASTSTSTSDRYTKPHKEFITGLAFSPNGRLLMSTGSDNTLSCWDLQTSKNMNIPYENIVHQENRTHQFQVHGFGNYNVCFIPSENKVLIIEVETGKRINALSGHYGTVNCCYLQKTRLELYSGGMDKSILYWSKGPRVEDSESSSNRNNSRTTSTSRRSGTPRTSGTSRTSRRSSKPSASSMCTTS